MSEHSVIVEFAYGFADLAELQRVGRLLSTAVETAGAGEYDGHEIAVDLTHGFFYLYGPDADKLYSAVRPVLEGSFTLGGKATLRYGPHDNATKSRTIVVGAPC